MEQILREETIGYLGLAMDGRPYVVPLNYGYLEGKILFHCAWTGQKLDYLRANPQECFAVGRQTGEISRHAGGNPCHVDSGSALCYGTAHILNDPEEHRQALNDFQRCFRPETAEITPEAAADCCAVEIAITEMTGRRESSRARLLALPVLA